MWKSKHFCGSQQQKRGEMENNILNKFNLHRNVFLFSIFFDSNTQGGGRTVSYRNMVSSENNCHKHIVIVILKNYAHCQ